MHEWGVESAVRTLGLHADELTVLADFAVLRAAEWTESAEGAPEHNAFAEFWRQRAQKWKELAAKEALAQTRYVEARRSSD